MGQAAAVRGALSGGRAGAGAAGRFLGRKSGASGFFFAVVGGGAASASSTGGVGAGGGGIAGVGGGGGIAGVGGGGAAGARPGRCRLRLTRGLAPAGGFARCLAAAGALGAADAAAGSVAGAAACSFGRSALQMAQQRNCASASVWTYVH